jgi:Ca2+-binding RTX toxin-like protein
MSDLTSVGASVTADEVMVRPDYDYTPPEVFYSGLGSPADVPGVFNVLDFGAVASATHDNRAAIQAAIDAATAAGGGLVHIPAGIYGMLPDPRDDGVIQLKDNVYLMGEGMGESTLRLIDGSSTKIVGLIRSPWGGNTDNWGVADLTIDGNRARTTGKVDGFYSGGIPGDVIADSDVTWLRVEAMNCSGYGFDPHERTLRLLIEDCVAHGNGLDGFVADHCIDTVYRSNLAYGNDRHGFNLVTTSNDMLLKDNVARDNGIAGIAVQRGSEDIATPHNVKIEGGELLRNGREGIQLWMTSNVLITGVDIRDSGTYGIRIRGASHVTVEETTITNSSTSGADAYPDIQVVDYYDIELDRTYRATSNLIQGNTITASDTTPSSRGIEERTPTSPDAEAVGQNAFLDNVISGQVRGLVAVSGATSVLRQAGTALADLIRGGGSRDTLSGGGGDDAIEGRGGADRLAGEVGADTMKGGDGDDTLTGGAGNDRLDGETGNDRIAGDAGEDRLIGGTGHDTLGGGSHNDYVTGGTGRDALSGGSGDDKLEGQDGRDRLAGGSGADTLKGGEEADVLSGGTDADSLYGETGEDRLEGGDGDDKLLGELGDDRLAGEAGSDTLEGGSGRDLLQGGAGDDKLIGGAGRDILEGGAGRDRFQMATGGGRDVVLDFEPGEDRIDLSAYDLSGFRKVEKLMDDTRDGVLIDLGAGTSILLRDVKAEELGKGDFML